MGNRHPSIAPYETFGASDGHFNLGIANDTQWRTFCAATGLESDPRFATIPLRVQNYDALRAQLDSVFRQKPVSYWIETYFRVVASSTTVLPLADFIAGAPTD